MFVLSARMFYFWIHELDALDSYLTICLDGTNELQHNGKHHRF